MCSARGAREAPRVWGLQAKGLGESHTHSVTLASRRRVRAAKRGTESGAGSQARGTLIERPRVQEGGGCGVGWSTEVTSRISLWQAYMRQQMPAQTPALPIWLSRLSRFGPPTSTPNRGRAGAAVASEGRQQAIAVRAQLFLFSLLSFCFFDTELIKWSHNEFANCFFKKLILFIGVFSWWNC